MNSTLHRLGIITATLVVLGGLVLWSVDAFSYTMNRTKDGKPVIWCKSNVVVYVDLTHVKHVPGVLDAVKSAFATWTSFGMPTSVKVVLVNKRLKADSKDNKNVIRWEKGEWKWSPFDVAKTVWRASAKTGCIKEADIILNAKSYCWGVVSPKKKYLKCYDVQNVLTHEVGHFFGLDHSKKGEATMYPHTPKGETIKRTLDQDDLNGIVYVVQHFNKRYSPSNDQTISTGSPGSSGTGAGGCGPDDLNAMGGCSMGPDGSTPAPWLLVLLALVGLSRSRRGRSGR